MEEIQVQQQQTEHQNIPVKQEAKPLSRSRKMEMHWDPWSRPKFSWIKISYISLICESLLLISICCSLLPLGGLDAFKTSKKQQYVIVVLLIFPLLVTITYCVFLYVALFTQKGCIRNSKIRFLILQRSLVFLFVGRLSFVIIVLVFFLVPKALEDLPSSPAPPAPALCPIPWVGYGERCYYLSATEANWTHSLNHCASQGGSLVTMVTPEEKNFVQRYGERIGSWIGVRRESLRQPWRRVDESLFNNSFPIRGEGLCAYVSGQVFKSTWCTNTRYWICSKQAH